MENCMLSNEEKRGSSRVQKLFMIAYLPKEDDPSRTPISLGRTVDISPSGVGMEVYKEVAVGTVIEMEIDLENVPVSAWGKVVRVDPLSNGNYHIGIRFDEEQELLQARIAAAEIESLRRRRDELEKILRTLVQTGWPWDEDGKPNELLYSAKDAFATAMLAAKELLDRSERSMITRTESKA